MCLVQCIPGEPFGRATSHFPQWCMGAFVGKQDGDSLLVLLKHLKVSRPSDSPSGTWAIWDALLHSSLYAKMCIVKAVCMCFSDLP